MGAAIPTATAKTKVDFQQILWQSIVGLFMAHQETLIFKGYLLHKKTKIDLYSFKKPLNHCFHSVFLKHQIKLTNNYKIIIFLK